MGWSEAKVSLTLHRAMKAVQKNRNVPVSEVINDAVTR
ncbi:hypothetical protein C2W64_01786 [Brevibacillus laterosporus]|nr:hypothetical protein C2W64_01786 [Brevibacillus laterosporus]